MSADVWADDHCHYCCLSITQEDRLSGNTIQEDRILVHRVCPDEGVAPRSPYVQRVRPS